MRLSGRRRFELVRDPETSFLMNRGHQVGDIES